ARPHAPCGGGRRGPTISPRGRSGWTQAARTQPVPVEESRASAGGAELVVVVSWSCSNSPRGEMLPLAGHKNSRDLRNAPAATGPPWPSATPPRGRISRRRGLLLRVFAVHGQGSFPS